MFGNSPFFIVSPSMVLNCHRNKIQALVISAPLINLVRSFTKWINESANDSSSSKIRESAKLIISKLMPSSYTGKELLENTTAIKDSRFQLFEQISDLLFEIGQTHCWIIFLNNIEETDLETLEALSYILKDQRDTKILFFITQKTDNIKQPILILLKYTRHWISSNFYLLFFIFR